MMIHKNGRLKLTDFNLAETLRRVRKVKEDSSKHSKKVQIFGTPDYIAP